MTKEELQQKEAQLDALALDIYEASEKQFTPQFPLLFVRVLPKEQRSTSGRIILQGVDQNKPVHEGIVLATWKDKVFEFGKVDAQGNRYTKQKVMRSEYAPGDHILFPHWSGREVHGWAEDKYKCVFELDWDFSDKGGVLGRIDHSVEDDTPRGILIDMLQELVGNMSQDRMIIATAHRIEERLMLLDRGQQSVTLSGR